MGSPLGCWGASAQSDKTGTLSAALDQGGKDDKTEPFRSARLEHEAGIKRQPRGIRLTMVSN